MAKFSDPPIRSDFRGKTWNGDGIPIWAWLQWFLAISRALSQIQNAPSITGSRGGNVALANLLTALDTAGIISNNTTP